MKRGVKVFLIILGCIFAFGIFVGIAGTRNMDNVRAVVIPDVDLQEIQDGLYNGSCDIGRWAVDVQVQVKDHRIVAVSVTDRHDFNATDGLYEQMNLQFLNTEDPRFDAVTGATISSKAYMIAVTSALKKQ